MVRAIDMNNKRYSRCVSGQHSTVLRKKNRLNVVNRKDAVGYCKYKAFRHVPGSKKAKRTGRVILADEDLSQAYCCTVLNPVIVPTQLSCQDCWANSPRHEDGKEKD